MNISFSMALSLLKQGKKVARNGWNGQGMWLELQTLDENSKITLPYIYMNTVQNKKVTWLASQTDLLSDDWYEVEEANEPTTKA